MNPLMMTAKLTHLTHQFRKKGLIAQELQELNQTYLRQYSGLSKEAVVEKFMKSFNKWLQHDLEEKGYWHNPREPEKYLSDLARVGTFSVFIYHGYLPEKHQEMLLPSLQKKLLKVFNLKNFKGFQLQFVNQEKCAYMTDLRLSWKIEQPETKAVPEGEVNVLYEMKRDFRKNLRQLRKDLEKSLIDQEAVKSRRKKEHRRHTRRKTKSMPVKTSMSDSFHEDDAIMNLQEDGPDLRRDLDFD